MRVKIKGEITAERLAESLRAATEKFEEARPGCRFFGANLYLTAYDADGLPFDLTDHRGDRLWLNIAAKSGELVRPALTEEGKKRYQNAEEEDRRLTEEAQAKMMAEYERERQERLAKEAATEEAVDWLNTTTAALLERDSDRFISALNEAVQAAWEEFKPVGTQGKKKGVPTPLPVFSCHEGGLLLSVETRKTPRRLMNPMLTLNWGRLKPLYPGDAWANAIERMMGILDARLSTEPKAQARRERGD